MSKLFLRQADTIACCKALQHKRFQINHHLLQVEKRHQTGVHFNTRADARSQHVSQLHADSKHSQRRTPCSEPTVLPAQPTPVGSWSGATVQC